MGPLLVLALVWRPAFEPYFEKTQLLFMGPFCYGPQVFEPLTPLSSAQPGA